MAHYPIPKPGEPVHLSLFYLEERRYPAVYFLYFEGRVVYVGQTKTLKWRIDTHLAEGVKEFDAIAFIRCTVDRLFQIEGYYIRLLAPKYNECVIARAIRERTPWKSHVLSCGRLGVAQAADYLGVREQDILDWRRAKFLPRMRVRRGPKGPDTWTREQLLRFEQEQPELIAAAKAAKPRPHSAGIR